jgi:hypothetical protein
VKKVVMFLKIKVMINFMHKIAVFWVKIATFCKTFSTKNSKNQNIGTQVWTDDPEDPHAVYYKASAVDDKSPNYFVSRQEDGGLVIDPQPG